MQRGIHVFVNIATTGRLANTRMEGILGYFTTNRHLMKVIIAYIAFSFGFQTNRPVLGVEGVVARRLFYVVQLQGAGPKSSCLK